jgi:hypothetical protein
MSMTEDVLNAIHSRLQSLSQDATPEQTAYLAKAFEAIAGRGKMIDIVHLADQKLDEMLSKTNEHLGALSAHYETFFADLEYRQIFFQDDALPFVFGILSRYNYYNYGVGGFTTELGEFSAANTANEMLKLLAGTHGYTTEYAGFYKEPSLCFLHGSKGNFIQKEMYLKYANSADMYNYPYAALGVFFVKNTTDLTIPTTVNIGGSSSVAGGAVFVGTPNSETEKIVWNNSYATYTNAHNFTGTASFNVPANTTIAILVYTSSYYIDGVSNFYAQFLHWYVHSFRSETLVKGLEIDVEKTFKAWRCKGLSTTYDLWR